MKEENYFYKGFDITDTSKKDKMRYEYFNPYGCNIYSSSKRVRDTNYDVTHTNQNNRSK